MPDRVDLRLEKLGVDLGEFSLADFSTRFRGDQYNILLGPTGSGKTTLIKCILGFIKTQRGKIFAGDQEITSLLPEKRRLGYIPQNYGLFPHLTVKKNIEFGVPASSMSESEARVHIENLVQVLEIDSLLGRQVINLSGGERQKVALARSLATKPRILLLDEPFSSIDEAAKRRLWFELKRVIQQFRITALHITHNLEEAEVLGETVSVMMNGRLAQSAQRDEVFSHPASPEVARFLGYRNIFSGVVRGDTVDVGHFAFRVNTDKPEGARVTVCIRPQDVKVIKPELGLKPQLERNLFKGTITALRPLLDFCQLEIKMDNSPARHDLELKFPRHLIPRYNLKEGGEITVSPWEPRIMVW